jgi:hypothetical protein
VTGVSSGAPSLPAPTVGPVTTTDTTGPTVSSVPAAGAAEAAADGAETAVAIVTATTEAPATMAETVVTSPPPATPGLLSRARTDGVTGPAVVALSVVLVACGVALDVRRDATLGLGTGVAFVLAALAGPAVVRFRSLLTAVVLQPVLFCGAAAALAKLGGQNRGSREVALDVGTTLALSAPLLFAGMTAALMVALVRVGRHLAARR